MSGRNGEQMQVLIVFIAMIVGMVVFAFIYAWTTVQLLMTRMEKGFSAQREKRTEERMKQNAKTDSILIELRNWRERQ
jgi:hypothetical protein